MVDFKKVKKMISFFNDEFEVSLYCRGYNEEDVDEILAIYEEEIEGVYILGGRAHA